MNYFGMFFTYMIPGIIIGIIVAAAFAECGRHKRRDASATRQTMANERYNKRASLPITQAAASTSLDCASLDCAAQDCAAQDCVVSDRASQSCALPDEARRKNKLYVCTLSEDAA